MKKIFVLFACAACLACAAAGMAAYIVGIDRSAAAGARGEGVRRAADILSSSVTPPAGNAYGISPLEADYAVDGAALAAAGISGEACLSVVVSYARADIAENFAAADGALREAVVSVSASAQGRPLACNFSSSCAGDGGQTTLLVRVFFSVPKDGSDCTVGICARFAADAGSAELFAACGDELFVVSADISGV